MNLCLEILATLAAFLVLVPTLVLALQVGAALLRPAKSPDAGAPPPADGEEPGESSTSPSLPERRPRVAVLVPAHDEATGIAATLDHLRTQLDPGDRLLVVADNCSDATASVARARGAQVLERRDRRRGKGHALDFGVRHLMADPPEVLLVVDADCSLSPGTVAALARQCAASGRPAQALDLMHSPPGAGLKTRMAEFAWVVKNHVRPLGFYRLGLPCQLMGTGMAFPWPLIAGAPLAGGHLVEDLKLGLDLARAGKPPRLQPAGQVHSRFPASPEGLRGQRLRWEHGHLATLLGEAPRLLGLALRRLDGPLLALALDLAVPPLALLALLLLASLAFSGVLVGLGLSPLPLALALAAGGFLGAAILAAWWGFGRDIVSFADLLAALAYIFWKIPLYLRFLRGRQVEWVRSKRDPP